MNRVSAIMPGVTDGEAGIVNLELYQEILDVAERISELVSQDTAHDPVVPSTTWTVTETAAHLAAANAHFAEIAAGARPDRHGDGSAAGLATANAQLLDRFTLRDAGILAVEIRKNAAAFVDHVRRRPASDVVDTPLREMTVGVFCGYLLTHMLGHGEGIAMARRQPSILTAHHVALTVPFLVAVMPRLVDPTVARQLDATFDVRLRDTARLAVRFDQGVATVTEQARPDADCVVSAEPCSFFLMSAGLRPLWPLMLSGKLRAWGRKPWLAFRLARAVRFP
jgi:hypothetical protein